MSSWTRWIFEVVRMQEQWIWRVNSNRWIAVLGWMLCQAVLVSKCCLGQVLGESADCPRCMGAQATGGSACVHRMTDYPVYESKFANPYRILDCRNEDCQGNALQRWKRSMQSSHWGYPEYFHGNTFGMPNRQAFSANIRDGAIERATLYNIDFYPEDSVQSQMLTPGGIQRLQRALCVSQAYGTGLRFEQASQSELTQLRRTWLAEHPEVLAAGITLEEIRPIARPMGILASEGIRRYQQGILNAPSGAQGSTGVGAGISGGSPLLQGTSNLSGGQSGR